MNRDYPERIIAVVLGLWLATTCDAGAYVDPGSGSYLFQLLIAGLTAAAFFFSTIKRKVVQMIRSLLRIRAGDEPSAPVVDPHDSRDA